MNDLIKIGEDIDVDSLEKYYIPNHVAYGLRYVDENNQVHLANFKYYRDTLLKSPNNYKNCLYEFVPIGSSFCIPVYPVNMCDKLQTLITPKLKFILTQYGVE